MRLVLGSGEIVYTVCVLLRLRKHHRIVCYPLLFSSFFFFVCPIHEDVRHAHINTITNTRSNLSDGVYIDSVRCVHVQAEGL